MCQMGTVAVPGSEVLQNMMEPVAIVAPNDELNVVLPENEVTALFFAFLSPTASCQFIRSHVLTQCEVPDCDFNNNIFVR